MKIIVLTLFWIAVGGLELHSFRQSPAPPVLEEISEEELLTEIKLRFSFCGERADSSVTKVSTEELLKEFKRRKCPPEGSAPAPAPAPGLMGSPGAAPAPGPATTTTTTTTTTGPDNFADEVVDQANVDFDMLDADGDGCISPEEMTKTIKDQVKVAESRDYYWHGPQIKKGRKTIVKKMTVRVGDADVNKDNCTTKEEFEALHHAIGDCKTQFKLMDVNQDGKVSRQEAATFVSDNMDHADLSWDKLRNIFKTADVNGDKYLSEPEFCEAGPRYKGDGDDK